MNLMEPIANFWDQRKKEWNGLRLHGPGQLQFWLLALLLGIMAGYATLAFRFGIMALQELFYGENDVLLASHAEQLPWPLILGLPVCGGLAVGLILHYFTPDGRVRGVAHVIEGAALRNGRVERQAGIASAAASLITLSTGGSSGREGPVVHMSASIATWVSDLIKVDGVQARDLMGCAVASAVAASFNAPLAGAIFALEVVLRHFNIHAFAPIAIASTAGAVIGRMHVGAGPEFSVEHDAIAFYAEIPAFMLLGILSGLVATVMMRSIFMTEVISGRVKNWLGIPNWLRPAFAGLLLGAIALEFPHIIGVGYETTYRALSGDLVLSAAILFAVVKVAAVSITFGGHMGGGVFSPALMLGALTGLAFGHVATDMVPELSGTVTVYALAGMAAVAAAVFGAPISTTLIALELTGNWQLGIGVLTAVSLSVFIADQLVHRSFFLTQLERAGKRIASGPHSYLLRTISVGRIARRGDAPSEAQLEAIAQGKFIAAHDTLERALPRLEADPETALLVVDEAQNFAGTLHYADALKAYNDALAERFREEHA